MSLKLFLLPPQPPKLKVSHCPLLELKKTRSRRLLQGPGSGARLHGFSLAAGPEGTNTEGYLYFHTLNMCLYDRDNIIS